MKYRFMIDLYNIISMLIYPVEGGLPWCGVHVWRDVHSTASAWEGQPGWILRVDSEGGF